MSLACDAGQVVVVGSPRGKAKDVNFYDDLHRRYIEVTGAHGNQLFEPAHTRLAGAWDINKAQKWLLANLAKGHFGHAARANTTALLIAVLSIVLVPWCWLSAFYGRTCWTRRPDLAAAVVLSAVCGASLVEWTIRLTFLS